MLINSLDVLQNKEKVFQAGEGAGASGSFFFFSYDGRFILKTILRDERELLLSMLDDYIDHIRDSDNQSLLARIYGIFSVKTDYFSSIDVLIMQNTARFFDPNKNYKYKFDLKGSSVNRYSTYNIQRAITYMSREKSKKSSLNTLPIYSNVLKD